MKKYRLLKHQVAEKEEELYNLKLERDNILFDYKEAIAQGDLSENSAYASAKLRLEDNTLRITTLEGVLNNHVIVEDHEIDRSKVDIGSKVTIKSDTVGTHTFTFVAEGEGSILKKLISPKSDIGNAIYAKSVGDKVEVKSISGEVNIYTITSIE